MAILDLPSISAEEIALAFGPFLLKGVSISGQSLILELADASGAVLHRPRRQLHHPGGEWAQSRAQQLIGSLVTINTLDPLRWPPKDWWISIAPYRAANEMSEHRDETP